MRVNTPGGAPSSWTPWGALSCLHGMNVNAGGKPAPLRVDETTREDILRLSGDWGFNAARLLVFWDGIEPVRGRYDESYLDRVAVRFGGDGAPEWAIADGGLPAKRRDKWELIYFEPGVKASISNFWGPGRGHPELAERFRADPAVLGCDLYNEPFLGNLGYFPHLYTLDLDLSGRYLGVPVFVNMWARARMRESLLPRGARGHRGRSRGKLILPVGCRARSARPHREPVTGHPPCRGAPAVIHRGPPSRGPPESSPRNSSGIARRHRPGRVTR